MATASFPFPSATIVLAGPVDTGTVSGHPYISRAGPKSQLVTRFTGTAVDIMVFVGATDPFTVIVDGGAPATITPAGSGWTVTNICTGLSDTLHTLVINLTNFFATDTQFTVTGAAPTITAPTTVVPSTFMLDVLSVGYLKLDGIRDSSVQGYLHPLPCAQMRFRANCTSLSLWCWDFGQAYCLYIDGVKSTVQTVPSSTGATAGYLVSWSGLSGTHLYEIATLSSNSYVASVMAMGGTGIDTGANLGAVLPVWAYYGDSIEQADPIGDLTNRSLCFMQLTAREMGVVAFLAGTGGASLVGYGDSHTAQVTGVSPLPAKIFTRYGTNDDEANVGNGTFLTSSNTLLAALVAGVGASNVYQLILLPEATFGPRIAVLRASATTNGVAFLDDTTGFNITAGQDTVDGRHPNAAGSIVLADNEVAYFTPSQPVSGFLSGLAGFSGFNGFN